MDGVESDTLIGLKRFHHSVHNRARFVDNKNSSTDSNDDDDSTNNLTKDDILGTNPHPTNLPAAREVEAFLYDIERDLLGQINDTKKRHTRKVNNTIKRIDDISIKLKQRKDTLVIMIDKTNDVYVLRTTRYID